MNLHERPLRFDESVYVRLTAEGVRAYCVYFDRKAKEANLPIEQVKPGPPPAEGVWLRTTLVDIARIFGEQMTIASPLFFVDNELRFESP